MSSFNHSNPVICWHMVKWLVLLLHDQKILCSGLTLLTSYKYNDQFSRLSSRPPAL